MTQNFDHFYGSFIWFYVLNATECTLDTTMVKLALYAAMQYAKGMT